MTQSFQQMNEEFAALQREFNAACDNQVRAVILEEMNALLVAMKDLLHPEEELKEAAG